MSRIKELQEEVYEANMELEKKNLVIYTFGNVSGIDRKKGLIAIKPSGVPYEDLRPKDMVIVDLDNKIVEGKLRPSSDTKTHILLYKHFPKIGGVCHTHSTYATAWAQSRRPLPCYGTTHADHATGDIPITEVLTDAQIERDYEEETGRQILDCFKERDPEAVEMVLVASHAPFTWGKSAAKAVYNSVVLEELARMAFLTTQINPKIEPIKKTLLDKHYQRKHGKTAYYGQA